MRTILGGTMSPMMLRKGGGGGGGSSTTTSGIDPEFKPYLKRVLSDVTDKYEADDRAIDAGRTDHIVADLSPEQREAHAYKRRLGREAQMGYDDLIDQDLLNAQGRAYAQQQGALGSARADRARMAGLADKAIDLRQASDQRKATGAELVGDVGAERQEMLQRKIDAPHTAASRYFGYLGAAPQSSTTSQSQSGGK